MKQKAAIAAIAVTWFASGFVLGARSVYVSLTERHQQELEELRDAYEVELAELDPPEMTPEEGEDRRQWLQQATSMIDRDTLYDMKAPEPEPVPQEPPTAIRDSREAAAKAVVNYQGFSTPPASAVPDPWTPPDEEPFVIRQEQYLVGETDYEQRQLTYYEGDDTLSLDPSGMVIQDPDRAKLVGGCLSNFGEESGEENVVYVRHPKEMLDLEITRSYGKYKVEVMGLEDD